MAFYTPPKNQLPVSKGGDIVIDFMLNVDDVHTSYGPGVAVRLEIDIPENGNQPAETLSVAAAISTYHAVCKIEAAEADTIPGGSLWRCVVSYPTIPESTEIVGMNGQVKREDGRGR